jgi:hypothetical protein
MKNLHTIYCQLGFLLKFTEKYRASFPSIENMDVSDDFRILSNLSKLLLKDSVLKLDTVPEKLIAIQAKNPIVKSMMKSERGRDKLQFVPEEYRDIQPDSSFFKDKYTEIFMLDLPENRCKEIEDNYGLLAFSPENLKKTGFLFQSDLIPVSKQEARLKDWNFIKKFRHPSNAMVLADNYLFTYHWEKNENLLPFLKGILPKRLNKRKFDLLILTADTPNTKYPVQVNRTQRQIKSALENYFSYSFDISIVKYRESSEFGREIHDRDILTNYLSISSGFGFNLFSDKQIKKDTHLSVFAVAYQKEPWQAFEPNRNFQDFPNSVLQIRASLLEQFNVVLEEYEHRKGIRYSNILLNYEHTHELENTN